MLPVNGEQSADSSLLRTSDGFLVVALFRTSGIAEGDIPAGLGPISALRIAWQQDSERWAILSEVSILLEARVTSCHVMSFNRLQIMVMKAEAG